MTWQDITIPMLRVLIGDMGETPTYSDDRLIQILLVSAMFVKNEISFSTTYTIDIINETISPDPSTDEVFLTLFVMYAACAADISTYRSKALLDGISARCGPVSMTVNGHSRSFKDLLSMGPCATYAAMKTAYLFDGGQAGAFCHAILSPFIGNNFDPANLASESLEDNRAYYH